MEVVQLWNKITEKGTLNNGNIPSVTKQVQEEKMELVHRVSTDTRMEVPHTYSIRTYTLDPIRSRIPIRFSVCLDTGVCLVH